MSAATASPTRFIRTRLTWQSCLMISYYSYLLNVLGPLTPFLRDELQLSYTLASFHFSAYAVGVILTGLLLNRVEARLGMKPLVWGGALGMALGAVLLTIGRAAPVTIAGAFLMGFFGVFLVALMNMALAEEQGPQHSAVAFTESSMIASLFAALSPVAVGFFARTDLTWRAALWAILLLLPVLWGLYGRYPLQKREVSEKSISEKSISDQSTSYLLTDHSLPNHFLGLPFIYWLYWFAIMMAVAIEFCIIFWAADYLEKVSGLARPDAALAVSAFLGAIMVGRGMVSRMLFSVTPARLLFISLLVAAGGFLLFWASPGAALAVTGLIVAGLGVAGLFPVINALALAHAANQMVAASGRLSLAIGIAILLLPLLLGRIADAVGIRAAYGLELVLILAALGLCEWARQTAKER